jgi:hypothetical protein
VWNHYNNLDEHIDEHNLDVDEYYDSHDLHVNEHNLHVDEHDLDDDAYVHTERQRLQPRRHCVL